MRSSLLFTTGALLVSALAGCPGDGEDAPKCSDYEPPASFDPQTPAVSFSNDVMPIFKQSCAFTACHGLSGSNNGVYLGDDKDAVHRGIVDVRTDLLPSMAFVKPGDPRNSFLMRKVDASQCVLDPQCVDKTCGEAMPKDEGTLPIETRDTIRRWIAQGAKND